MEKVCPNCKQPLLEISPTEYQCEADKITFSLNEKGELSIKAQGGKGKIQQLEEEIAWLRKENDEIKQYLFGEKTKVGIWPLN